MYLSLIFIFMFFPLVSGFAEEKERVGWVGIQEDLKQGHS